MRTILALTVMAIWTFAAPVFAAAGGDNINPLVDAAWVEANAGRPDVVILDIRNKIDGGSEAVYREGHVPGAVYSDYLQAGWRTTANGVVGQLPPVEALESLIGGLGIGNDSHVVIVAGGTSALDMGSATRVYWTFKVLGHDRVSILDGGHRAYTEAGYPIETGTNTPAPKIFSANFRPELLADHKDVQAAAERQTALLDMRPPEQFRGESAHPKAARPGTIPGAVNVPESQITDAGGKFVGADALRGLLKAVGVSEDQESIAFCNTGHWASLGWFAESEILGNKKARLYDGSMVDWTSRSELPVAGPN